MTSHSQTKSCPPAYCQWCSLIKAPITHAFAKLILFLFWNCCWRYLQGFGGNRPSLDLLLLELTLKTYYLQLSNWLFTWQCYFQILSLKRYLSPLTDSNMSLQTGIMLFGILLERSALHGFCKGCSNNSSTTESSHNTLVGRVVLLRAITNLYPCYSFVTWQKQPLGRWTTHMYSTKLGDLVLARCVTV